MKRQFLYGILSLMAVACKQTEPAKNETIDKSINQAKDSAGIIIRNNVELATQGNISVQQAFMIRGNGALVNDSNNVAVGEMVELRLLVKGWKTSSDSIKLGASENILTNEGTKVLEEKDLFEKQPAIPLSQAQLIRMQAVVTKQEKDYDYYKVEFKVWNKNADQSLSGNYKIYVR